MLYKKLFIEIRFATQLDVLDKKGEIIKAFWPKLFKHWIIEEQNNIIRLRNEKDLNKNVDLDFLISPQRLWYTIENPISKDYATNEITTYLKKLTHWIKPEIFSRVGVRGYTIKGSFNFEEYIKKSFNGEVFNQTYFSKLKDAVGVKDFAITLESSNTRIIWGPMKNDEDHYYLKEFVNIGELPEAFMFFDIDCFESDIRPDDLFKTVNRLHSKVCSIPEQFDVSEK